MMTDTKKQQLIFSGTLALFFASITYGIYYFGILKFHLIWVLVVALIPSLIITAIKFGFSNDTLKPSNRIFFTIFFAIYSLNRWSDYFNDKKPELNLGFAVLYTFFLIIILISYFKKKTL